MLLLALAIGLVMAGCAGASSMNDNQMKSSTQGSAQMGYVKIKPEEGKKMMEENKNIVLVDVRTKEEYAEKHIPGARLVPNESITDKEIAGLNKDDTIIVYCRSGHRSQQAAQKLVKIGYTHVYDMGGINSWPYETEAGAYQDMGMKNKDKM